MSRWSEVSKAVGWDPTPVSYPTIDQVLLAGARRDTHSLLRWTRFLPSPANHAEQIVMKMIVEKAAEERARLDRLDDASGAMVIA